MSSLHSFLKPFILVVVGAVVGVAIYVTAIAPLAPSSYSCQKQSGTPLVELSPQASQYHYNDQQPTNIVLKSSKPLFSEFPGDRFSRTYFMPCGKNCHPAQRSLRQLGWDKANEMEHAQLIYVDSPTAELSSELQSWQRFNHIPNHTVFSRRDEFLSAMAEYQNAYGSLDFLPQTYRLYNEDEYASLQRALEKRNKKSRPWIFKQGINHHEIGHSFIPSSREVKHFLKHKLKNRTGSVQQYICNQMTWNDQEFVVRVFWFVASLDPLLVMYQDGFVRIGYCRGEMKWILNDDKLVSFDYFEAYLSEANDNSWKNRVLNKNEIDPLMHVRNQIKAALASIATAVTLKPPTSTSDEYGKSEDAFGVFAADFIIDKDLDVWLGEVYHYKLPSGIYQEYLTEDYYFLLQKNHELWYGMGTTLEEVWSKQQRHVNLLPLVKTGKWQLIVAGDQWKFEYSSHERDNRKKAKSCKLMDDPKLVRAMERQPVRAKDERDETESSNQVMQ